ncbi:hypothetical protein I4U23_000162 [Adineta vaga]|nr:hypothetical protein I4U23_000162 [Adineta vaga]
MSTILATQLSDLSTDLVLYYLIPIYIIGILGNIFNVIIFSRHTLRLNRCSQYFIGMSIAQIIFFNSLAITRIIIYSTGYDLGRTISILCKIRNYPFVFGMGLMRQFLCLISIDRWIATTKNANIRRLSSPRTIRGLIIGSTLFWLLFSIHAPIGYQISQTRGCTNLSNPDYALFYAIQITVSAIVPFIIMVVFSILTLRNIRSPHFIQIAAQNTVPSVVVVVAKPVPQSIHRRRREMQLIKLSLLQVIFYVFLSMIGTINPLYSVLTNSQTKTSDQNAIDAFVNNTSLLLIYTYSAITFILYTLASKTFRKQFILTCYQVFKYIHFKMKRERIDSFDKYDENKRIKNDETVTTKCDSNENRTVFENLPNGIIYEIYEYLDFYHIYQSFYNLNYRFRSLLLQSSVPLKINLFMMPQTTFNRYNQDIIIPNTQRIDTLRIENCFIFDDQIVALLHKTSLRTLILENIRSTCLHNVLHQLITFPFLSSLSITTLDIIKNKNPFYQQIFRESYFTGMLPMATNEYSPIEYLIINHEIYCDQLDAFFSYVPHLRHLSLHLLHGYAIIPNKSFSSVLKWEHLISTYLVNLRIFNAQFQIRLFTYIQLSVIDKQFNLFSSSFWTKQQWFFDYRSLKETKYNEFRIIYSTNPYRRKNYKISNQLNNIDYTDQYGKVFKSVNQLYITNEKAMEKYLHYFPNVTKLTVEDAFSAAVCRSFTTNLNRILPLQQLQTLNIKCNHLSLSKIMNILSSTPNVHTLTFQTMSLYKESEIFQSVSKTNRVINVAFARRCTFNKLKLLAKLFPRLQHLQINILMKDMKIILEFLLNNNKENTPDLELLCFTSVSKVYLAHLNNLIKLGAISSDQKANHTGTKRRRTDSFDDLHNADDQKKQLTTTKNFDSTKSITQFEHLANELIYEIFEYLDYYYVYKGFFDLNYRFRSLLMQTTLPLKINLFPMSQTSFNRYNHDIIIPNTQRIHTLRIENYFMFDQDILALSHKTFLRSLFLENIESKYLNNLFDQLTSLLQLSLLTIITIDKFWYEASIYQKIFSLPSLKYCKVSLWDLYAADIPPCTTNDYSLIEHLIIVDEINLQQLNSFLSYVPHLRHLKVDLTQPSRSNSSNPPYYTLENLTHVSFTSDYTITFIELQELFINHFLFLEILNISAITRTLDANEWKRLISMHLPNLRIFDVFFRLFLSSNDENIAFGEQVNRFRSSFWIERQWFFDCRLRQKKYGEEIFFYSINPCRRKDYTVCNRLSDIICENETRNVFKSVDHVQILNEKVMEKCNDYFPNATKLTIKNDFCADACRSIPTSFGRILHLQKLQTLIIKCDDLPLSKLIELLTYIPNLHTLIFQIMSLYEENKISIEQSETFQSVSKTNSIKNMICRQRCTLEKVKLLVMLFPRLQHLTIDTLWNKVESILQFLLNKNNENTRDLVFLSLTYADTQFFDHLNELVMLKTLPHQYKSAHIYPELFVWW